MPHAPAAVRSLFAPTMTRAVLTLVFAAATIFVVGPSLGTGIWLLAGWMAATGACMLWADARSRQHAELDLDSLASVPRSTGIMWLLGAVAVVILPGSEAVLALVVSVVLILVALPEAWLGTSRRGLHPLARDWQIVGLVLAVAAIGVLLVAGLGTHAILGVVGGAAVIAGVDLVIAAVSLRRAEDQPARDQPVQDQPSAPRPETGE